MYALRNLLDKNPIQIAGALMAWANLAVVAGWVHLQATEVAGLNGALVLTLGLFVTAKTANKAVLNELAQDPPTVDGVRVPAAEVPKGRTRRGEAGQSVLAIIVAIVLAVLILKLLGVF